MNLTPNGKEGATWNSAAGMAADGNGNIFLLAANGTFDSALNASGFPINGDYGNASLRLSTKGGLLVTGYFDVKNEVSENGNDIDLGSAGAMLVNQNDSTAKTWLLGLARERILIFTSSIARIWASLIPAPTTFIRSCLARCRAESGRYRPSSTVTSITGRWVLQFWNFSSGRETRTFADGEDVQLFWLSGGDAQHFRE